MPAQQYDATHSQSVDEEAGIEGIEDNRSWMTALIYHVTSVLEKDIKLMSLGFQNPLDMLKK